MGYLGKFGSFPGKWGRWISMALILGVMGVGSDLGANPWREGLCCWDDFFENCWCPHFSCPPRSFPLEIQRGKDCYTIEVELPGVKKNEIELSVQDQVLCITVSHSKNRGKGENGDSPCRECRSFAMNRCIRFNDGNFSKVSAKLEDGILRIKVPKLAESSDGKKIAIE
jgi:HSP20 family protein